ncbi:MAG: glycerol-3-phosphate dehydrogenase/oxidase [Planctomycetes bacterium]|nr:glycerol-3-phosphate dehydrogenase/oxidase [Planctomycetota bacterium]MCB9903558.1 glycerol-3-phosphate dehydrogenase/oxidase [Planctomycetota bacterium]
MTTADYDLVVVGGGIHGAGVLQAAAARGLRCLLIESREPASGTSSKSSKLIHGGLRYLESGDFGLVRESLTERAILLHTAPHLVRLVPFFIPVYRATSRAPWMIRAGLTLYALLGNLRPAARFESLPRERWGELDGLTTDGLRAVFRYYDGQTDDAALTRAVIASALELGAQLAMPADFNGATRESHGYRVRFGHTSGEREATTSTLVNAGGPWVEDVRRRVTPEPPGRDVDLVGGTHIELPGTLERGIYYTEAPRDRRAVFHMPWKGHTLVGTTERVYDADPRKLEPTAAEVDYLRETFAHHFPVRSTEVLASWSGLRVLPHAEGAAFARSRETILMPDNRCVPRLLGIYGGKLTGYRATAEKVLHRLTGVLPVAERRADTRTLRLPPDPGADALRARAAADA